MKNNEYKIIVTSLVPHSIGYSGKTGASVRLTEILKRFNRLDNLKIAAVSSGEHFFDYLRENGIDFERISIKSNLKFKSLTGLCLKSLIIITKSFFVLKLDFLENKDRKVILYSSSDLFWEVIPAFFFKTRKKNTKWIQVIHHVYPDWRKRPGRKAVNFFGYFFQRFSFWLIKKKADKIILVSNLVKNKLAKIGFFEDRMSVSPNGIDLGYFENIKKAELEYDGVFLGRLSRSKGISDLIDIWKNVCGDFPEARLAVIGGGNEAVKKYLQKKIGDYNLEKNIDLLGFLEDERAHTILKSGKVFLFPSHEEGWGIAIAEAMACGLPVVSWDLPIFREIFNSHSILVKENNINQFSEKIIELLKNNQLRREIGDGSRDFVKKYSWEKAAEKELKIITS